MNRRGFLGLLRQLATVGAAMSVAPSILAPLNKLAPPKKLSHEELRQQIQSLQEWLKSAPVVELYTLAS